MTGGGDSYLLLIITVPCGQAHGQNLGSFLFQDHEPELGRVRWSKVG